VDAIALTADTRLSNFRNVDVLFAQHTAIKQLGVKHSTIDPKLEDRTHPFYPNFPEGYLMTQDRDRLPTSSQKTHPNFGLGYLKN